MKWVSHLFKRDDLISTSASRVDKYKDLSAVIITEAFTSLLTICS